MHFIIALKKITKLKNTFKCFYILINQMYVYTQIHNSILFLFLVNLFVLFFDVYNNYNFALLFAIKHINKYNMCFSLCKICNNQIFHLKFQTILILYITLIVCFLTK